MVREASAFADRVRREAGSEPRAQVQRAWRLAFGRSADEGQVCDAVAYLAEQADHYRAKKPALKAAKPEQQALATFCQALLGSNPFLYVE
jgi:hypothetical protein